MKKKIIFFSHESKMYGAPRSMLILAAGIKEQYDVEILTFGHGDLVAASRAAGVPIRVIEGKRVPRKCSSDFFRKILGRIERYKLFLITLMEVAKRKPDLVYINTVANHWPVVVSRILRLNMIVHVRESRDYIFPECPYRDKSIDAIIKYCNNFVCVSEAVRSLVVERLDRRPANVSLVYNGIDCFGFSDVDLDGPDIPGVGQKTVVGFLGNLSPRKGVDVFLRAAGKVLKDRNDIVFVIVGGNRGDFIQLANEVCGDFEFSQDLIHIPFISKPQSVLKVFDIFCMTSYSEPFARVNLEASCLKLPVIATNVDGNKEFFINGASGVLFSAGDANALAIEIVRLVDDPELRSELGLAAFRRVNQEFTVDRYILGCRDAIQKAITG